jgi:hypothetical protein
MNTLRKELDRHRSHVFCAFPEDARWNAERQPAEFGVEIEIGEDRGVPRGACSKGCCPSGPPPSRADPVESIAERKRRRRQLTEDGNVEISGRIARGLKT